MNIYKSFFISSVAIVFALFGFGLNIASAQSNVFVLGSPPVSTTTPSVFQFTKDLKKGDFDPDVKYLQKFLNSDSDTTIALSGTGSSGSETSYFGDLTKKAVIKFQEKYREVILTPNGLTSGTGFVGKSTRAKLNSLILAFASKVSAVKQNVVASSTNLAVSYGNSTLNNGSSGTSDWFNNTSNTGSGYTGSIFNQNNQASSTVNGNSIAATTSSASNPLIVFCSPNLSSVIVGNTIVWSSQVNGGNGTYSYSWTGDDSLSGISSTVSKSYYTAGIKKATLEVMSGGRIVTSNCSVYVTDPTSAINTASSSPSLVDPLANTLATTTPPATTPPETPPAATSATTTFGGTIAGVYPCPKEKETTWKIAVEGTSPLTGWVVYYAKSKLATTTSSGGSTQDFQASLIFNIILGSALNDGGPGDSACTYTSVSGANNPVGLLYYKKLGYIQEFGTSPDYGQE